MDKNPFFKEGHNCWKQSIMEKGSLVADCAQYYEELYKLLPRAKKSIYICGWDFDSRTHLIRDGKNHDLPTAIGELLVRCIENNPELNVYILVWDSNIFYSTKRESLPLVKLGLLTPNRLHYRKFREHPFTSSQHQKIVVIDDNIAYCGGMDITSRRWDTSDHEEKNIYRTTQDGEQYTPYHDITFRVKGPIVTELSQVFRNRWEEQTCEKLPLTKNAEGESDPLPWEFSSAPIAVSRTLPPFKTRDHIQETKEMVQDLIGHAQKHIYIENQYLTDPRIVHALSTRLREKNGPYITIVLPKATPHGLGNQFLKFQRDILLWRLQQSDTHSRLGLFAPVVGKDALEIYVHSKILFCDHDYCMIGTSNLNERSMGLDTECDLTIFASTPAVKKRVSRTVNERISELSNIPVSTLEKTPVAHLHTKIRAQKTDGKHLEDIHMPKPKKWKVLAMKYRLADYDDPIQVDRVIDASANALFWPKKNVFQSFIMRTGMLLGLVLVIVLLWQLTPLSMLWESDYLRNIFVQAEQSSYSFPIVVAAFCLLGIVCVPVNLLIVITATIFSAKFAFPYIWISIIASSALNYGIGRLLGRKTIKKFIPGKVRSLTQKVAQEGLSAHILIRMVPIAPFGIMNHISGAFELSFKKFLIGTFLGMIPGTAFLILFQRSLLQAILTPSTGSTITLLAYVLAITILTLYIRKRVTS